MRKFLNILYTILVIQILCILSTSAIAQFQQKPMLGVQVDGASLSSKGLVGYWLFNEGSGNKVFDLSGNGYTIDFVNSPTWTSGKYGSAILFDDGSDQHLKISKAIITSTPLTIACWFNTNEMGASQELVSIQDTTALDNFFRLSLSTAADVVKATAKQNGGAAAAAQTTTSYSVNTWHFACGVFYANNSRAVFIDGGSKGTNGDTQTPSGIDTVGIGALLHNPPAINAPFSGLIVMVLIYNRALTAREIAELYLRPFAMFVKDDIAILATAAVPPPAPSGQVITIQMSMISVLFALVLIRRKLTGDSNGFS